MFLIRGLLPEPSSARTCKALRIGMQTLFRDLGITADVVAA
ncbi:hypothetical protein SAMN05216276_106520 [Streptosporangium subroseum]|uniref:Uncharacterized protein n=1 Tax=Streptosporangium subroseum TaxID=106412 RepID=A0A239NPN7_9ACTN|nr:hypothetical protein SAMN05216276_106520 [Streptosporangium subroseum]